MLVLITYDVNTEDAAGVFGKLQNSVSITVSAYKTPFLNVFWIRLNAAVCKRSCARS